MSYPQVQPLAIHAKSSHKLFVASRFHSIKCRPRNVKAFHSGSRSAASNPARPHTGLPAPLLTTSRKNLVQTVCENSAQCALMVALAVLWLIGRPAPASAGVFNRPSGMQQLETVVTLAPQASVTASVTNPNDSMLMIVAVCLGFYALSATISAAIGAIMHLSGRSLQYATRGATGWSSAGILDTFDIMRLPLAYEIDEPRQPGSSRRGPGSSDSVVYVPWDGPEASYIPVNMVKVLQPGFLEAGLVAKRSMLPPEQDLSIISVTRPGQLNNAANLLTNGNSNGNGNGNGRSSNGKGPSNGSKGQ